MGEIKQTIEGNVDESYIEDSRNFEQHYYTEILKPHKLEFEINSHKKPEEHHSEDEF